MRPHTRIPARAAAGTGAAAIHRGRTALARAGLAVGVLAAAAVGTVLAEAGPAAAAPAVLYAAAAAAGTGDCSTAADACTLSTALTSVAPGGTIELVTPGGTAHYVGNWTVTTNFTADTTPVTIEPAPGVSNPTLDGNGGINGTTCPTGGTCNGPVLTVPSGEFVALSGITIANGNNADIFSAGGGGLDNAGTVTITGSTFASNTASGDGGAIDSGDGGGGSVTVTASTFTGNTTANFGHGGAIDSGDNGGSGTVQVTASTFTGNTASGGTGGAINSGELGGGAVHVTASTFTKNSAQDGGAIESGSSSGGGSVTVTASTFTGNTASSNGGAIDSGDNVGAGTVQVTASTFAGNSGFDGGAIDSGDGNGGGTVQVTASTFAGNSANDGGAIDSGDNHGGGTAQVTASTFKGNTATNDGNTIDSGDFSGAGTVQVAGDLFDGSCHQPGGGTWTDGGYNAGTDDTCFASTLQTGDKSDPAVGSDLQTALTGNGGPTQTIAPTTGNPAIALIPDPTTITLGSQVTLCPALDQRGYPSAASTACDAGAVQTSGSPPALTLTDSAAPGSFNAAGQMITYFYKVSNTGAGTLTGISVTDPAVPGVSCPAASLASGASETCKGSYTTTAADLAAGKITDTATAGGATANGVPVAPSTATVTVPEDWPPAVTGVHQPAAHAAEGYYLGVKGSTWQLLVTHPGTGNVAFTGQVSVPVGTLGHLALINPVTGHQVTLTGKAITFTLPDSGTVTGFQFTTSTTVTSITLTLNIAGHPATASQLFLGGTAAHPAGGSPLTFTR